MIYHQYCYSYYYYYCCCCFCCSSPLFDILIGCGTKRLGSITRKMKNRENSGHWIGWLCNTPLLPPLSFLRGSVESRALFKFPESALPALSMKTLSRNKALMQAHLKTLEWHIIARWATVSLTQKSPVTAWTDLFWHNEIVLHNFLDHGIKMLTAKA